MIRAAAIAAFAAGARRLNASPWAEYGFGTGGDRPARPYLDAAVAAARWIRTAEIDTPAGVTWAADPSDLSSTGTSLYTYSAGVVPFLLELHAATGDEAYLRTARRATDHLIAEASRTSGVASAGLYSGIAGIGYVCQIVYQRTRDKRYAVAARDLVRTLQTRAHAVKGGLRWDDCVDIISGSAGVGLFLLRAAKVLDLSEAGALAVKAGRHLIDRGEPVGEGRRWLRTASSTYDMPNFSHGTAGVAYFMAELYRHTRDRAFLDAALDGARYLRSVATCGSDGCLIHHNDRDGGDLYYLGWCHGPVGTTRLFYLLGRITRQSEWDTLVRRQADAVLGSGIPEQRTPGFWQNISLCCGNAAALQWGIDLYGVTQDTRYLAFGERCAADLLRRATPVETSSGKGLQWIQAEHRDKPDLVLAQVGLMQGAAGAGLVLLHLDGNAGGRKHVVTLPDSPFAAG